MHDFGDFFTAALKHCLEGKPFGYKSKMAREVGISPSLVGDMLSGRTHGSEEKRRAIASHFGYTYDEFLDIGRALIAGKPIPEPEPPRPLTADEMSERGFITIPFSDNMRLAAGGGGRIPIDEDADASTIIVHGPSLKRRNARNLQAFRVGGDSMEPLIAEGGIVLVDTGDKELQHIADGKIYVLCWDLYDGECAVKYLRWVKKGKTLSIESENPIVKPIFKDVDEVQLIGRVIWSWREH